MVEAKVTFDELKNAQANVLGRAKPCLRDWQGLPWLQAIIKLRFDLEIGAVIDVCYPDNCLS